MAPGPAIRHVYAWLASQQADRSGIQCYTSDHETMKLQPPCPRPLPELKPRPDHVASSVQEIIGEARSQLEVYQGSRGVLMNLPDLTWAAATASPLPTPDEISFTVSGETAWGMGRGS